MRRKTVRSISVPSHVWQMAHAAQKSGMLLSICSKCQIKRLDIGLASASAPKRRLAHLTKEAEASGLGPLSAILIGALILQIGNSILQTVIPLRMAVQHVQPILIGVVSSAYAGGYLIGCFLSPLLFKRVGHIRAFAVFAAVQCAATLSFPYLHSELWAISRSVMGLAAAGHGICIESWISGQTRASQRGRIFGIYQVLNRSTLIIAQLGASYASAEGAGIFTFASSAFSLALIPVALTRARSPDTPEVISPQILPLCRMAPASVVGCIYAGVIGGGIVNIVPAYGILINLDQRTAVLLAIFMQLGSLLMQWPLGRVADRVDSRVVMLCTTATVIFSSSTLLIWSELGHLLDPKIFFVIFTVIGGGSLPLYAVSVTHAYQRLGETKAVGLSAGLLFLWALGSAVGPVVTTGLMQVFGPQAMIAFIVALSVALVFYLASRLATKPLTLREPNKVAGGSRPPAMPEIGPRPR
jgi:MFS family permease